MSLVTEMYDDGFDDGYNQALNDFRETFADRITYDEEVVYVDSDECIAVSRASIKRLVDKLVKEMKH